MFVGTLKTNLQGLANYWPKKKMQQGHGVSKLKQCESQLHLDLQKGF